jgi:hypothetical protein
MMSKSPVPIESVDIPADAAAVATAAASDGDDACRRPMLQLTDNVQTLCHPRCSCHSLREDDVHKGHAPFLFYQ